MIQKSKKDSKQFQRAYNQRIFCNQTANGSSQNATTLLSFFQIIMWMKKVLMIFMISSIQVSKSNGNNIDYSLFGTPRFKLKAGNCENGGNPTYIVEG